jgi:ribosomal protein S18 acetylase RimI-like enzyme
MEDEIIVREMKKEDRKHILDIIKKIKIFNDEDQRIAIELVEEVVDGPNKEEYYVQCAVKGNKILGYICYGPASLCVGTYEVYYIAVDPDNFRGGIGKLLMVKMEEALKEKKARLILLETSSSEEYNGTRNFYLKLGYKEAAKIKDYFKEGEDRVIYEKKL